MAVDTEPEIESTVEQKSIARKAADGAGAFLGVSLFVVLQILQMAVSLIGMLLTAWVVIAVVRMILSR